MADSIITTEKKCFFCGSQRELERHHCCHGTANRKLADEDGLWVWLCPDCHRGKYGVHGYAGHEYNVTLKKAAEYAWLEQRGLIVQGHPTAEGLERWISRYQKNWLG